MATIHWVGTGLSTLPGLRKLAALDTPMVVWNRTLDKAQAAVGDLVPPANIRRFDLEALMAALAPGDVAISMLPGDWHVPIAQACLSSGAHFVSSSYISPQMRSLDPQFKAAGLVCINEIGLDPGIDHLMAHWLVADYRGSAAYDPANALSFISYCGGIPKIENDFRYKFSWSPLGVLKALRSPSKSIRDHQPLDVARPWDALSSYTAPLATPERFEVYPNRDSLPFMTDYQFDPDWKVKLFVRGTLRLNGWADAWHDIFREIETLEGAEGEARLTEMSEAFWQAHAYDEGEPDRVVLCVGLKAERDGKVLYDKTYAMDAWGDARGSAMARLVSGTVALGVESVLAGELDPGVQAAPSALALVNRWMAVIDTQAQHNIIVDHTQ